MIVNEYTLIIPSGSDVTQVFQAGRAEYYAGFSTSENYAGHIHIEESFYPTGPFRTVYGADDKQIKWTAHGSGIFAKMIDTAYHPYIRFRLAAPTTETGAIYLRTFED